MENLTDLTSLTNKQIVFLFKEVRDAHLSKNIGSVRMTPLCLSFCKQDEPPTDAIFRLGAEINLEIIKRFVKDNDYTH